MSNKATGLVYLCKMFVYVGYFITHLYLAIINLIPAWPYHPFNGRKAHLEYYF